MNYILNCYFDINYIIKATNYNFYNKEKGDYVL